MAGPPVQTYRGITAEIRNAAHAANETVVQCEVIYFMVMHNILEYTGLLARGMAADGWLCDCEGRSIPAMEYSESCAILLLCLLLPLGPLHVLLEGVVDHEQLLAGVVDHVVQLLQGVVDHGQLLGGVVDHGQLLEGGVRHELLLARLWRQT